MEKPGLTLPLLTGLSFSSGSPRGNDREDAKNGLNSTQNYVTTKKNK
jgi:hypothetical protein